jgi:hypothetical protein
VTNTRPLRWPTTRLQHAKCQLTSQVLATAQHGQLNLVLGYEQGHQQANVCGGRWANAAAAACYSAS